MNFIRVLSCLTLLVTAAAAQHPKPCESPPLMSGGHTVMVGEGITATGNIAYDAFAQRVRVREVALTGNHTAVTEQLMLFSEKVYYEIDWSRVKCTKKKLDGFFVPMHVPKDAKLMGQVFMGSSSSWGMGVLTNTWYGSLPGNGLYSNVFTEIGCIPLTYTSYTPAHGWITVSTFNWVVGLSNPMDFVPPSICERAELEETETIDNFFTALRSLAIKS
ncbi:ependymin-like [Stegastes partitus]|uniref:Ependymin-like n=2 Tax=Stegastes partitus TaxID=144197 RepID=A0A9Y4NEX8_9TELE|nr:PREDICTED: ependymin-like [Stegastes partitus]